MGREVKIEFLNPSGKWEFLSEINMEYLPMHKDRTLTGTTRAGTSTTFRAIAVDSGEVLEIWHSDGV